MQFQRFDCFSDHGMPSIITISFNGGQFTVDKPNICFYSLPSTAVSFIRNFFLYSYVNFTFVSCEFDCRISVPVKVVFCKSHSKESA